MKPQTYINNRKELSDDLPIVRGLMHTAADLPNVKPDLRSALKYLMKQDKKLAKTLAAVTAVDPGVGYRSDTQNILDKEMANIALKVEALFNIDLEVLIGWIEDSAKKVPSQHDMTLMRMRETVLSLYLYLQAREDWQKTYIEKIKSRRI